MCFSISNKSSGLTLGNPLCSRFTCHWIHERHVFVGLAFVRVSRGGAENRGDGAGVVRHDGDDRRLGLFTAAASTRGQVEVHEDDDHGHHAAQQRGVAGVEGLRRGQHHSHIHLAGCIQPLFNIQSCAHVQTCIIDLGRQDLQGPISKQAN